MPQATKESLHLGSMMEGRFGSLAAVIDESGTVDRLHALAEDSAAWPADRRCAWFSAVARELLLAEAWGARNVIPASTPFRDALPFESPVPLSELIGRGVVVACFPLDHASPGDLPPWATLWLVEGGGADMRGSFSVDSLRRFDPGNRRLFIHVSRPGFAKISGTSWTLAAHLARRVLEEAGEERCERARQLALDWMLTGEVDGDGTLRRIEVGNKLKLRTARKWLFPDSNRGDVLGQSEVLSELLSNAFFPATTDAAWIFFTGKGIVDGQEIGWPEVEVIHSFTSGAWEPIVASLLLAAPGRLVLWHSNNPVSADPATHLETLFSSDLWSEHPPKVVAEPLSDPGNPSNPTLAETRNRLLEGLTADLESGRTVLFNITQGNRIMALAAHEVAKLYPNLWLLYRDLDAEDFFFTVIRYAGALPTTETIRRPAPEDFSVTASVIPEAVWSKLFFKTQPRPAPQPGDIAEILGGRQVGKKVKFPPEIPFT